MIFIILGVVLHLLFPVIKLVHFPWILAGLIFIGVGGLFNLFADMDFKKTGTTVKPFGESTELMTNGVFKYSRNPMYLGMGLTLIGEAVLLGSITPFISAFVFFVMLDRLFINIEEENLTRTFGEKYKSYINKVRRWI